MTTAMDKQVGGNHYKRGIQPFELSHANYHDGETHAVQKYLTRFEHKAGIEDLKKAHHIVDIRYELILKWGAASPGIPRIKLDEYLRSNDVKGHAAAAILAMESWFRKPFTQSVGPAEHRKLADQVRRLIRETAKHHYPDIYNEEDFV